MLIAGAGSGKTRVLTERVRWLMDQGVAPRRICAITFTNKAAGELKDRLGIGIHTPPDKEPRVSTIHSLALNGIRKNPPAFGLADKVTPLDEWDQQQLMKKVIERYNEKNKREGEEKEVYVILDKISFHRARGLGFRDEYTEAVHKKAQVEHSGYHAMSDEHLDIWEAFEDEKRKNSVVDFDDMLHLVVRRLRTDPKWKASLQKQFDHVLMDEAQDTNPVQWEFVNGLLGPDNKNLYVVGDMSQSIYGFSGAVPALLKEYSEGWRGTVPTMYRIARNHRSLQVIVQLANKIQKTMTHTIPLQMETHRPEEGDFNIIAASLPQDIANGIATQIQKDARRKVNPILYKENAILVRSGKTQVRDLEGELVRRRIPYIVRGGRGLLQTEEVRDILAYLRLTTNRKDYMTFTRCCAVPRCGVGDVALAKLRIEANQKYDGDLLEAAKTNDRLHNLVSIIDQITLFKDDPVNALQKLLALFDYRKYVAEKYKKDKDKVRVKLENIERFVLMVVALTEGTEQTLDDLIFKMTLDRPNPENEKALYDQQLASGELTQEQYDVKMEELQNGSVTISTIHSAKGLEWKRVYVTNIYEGSLPHRWSMGSDEEIEEERRLFYVACTRARDTLVLCVPRKIAVQSTANFQRLAPSRFLKEINVSIPAE